jgi:PadR family transcriptional regulator
VPLVDIQKEPDDTPFDVLQEKPVSARADIMQGTLDLMVLRTLETLGPQHGWGIAQRLEQVSEEALRVNQGTLYPALLRLEQRRLIRSRWGTSENNRRARFYSLTAAGRRQLVAERKQWRLVSGIIERLLTAEE